MSCFDRSGADSPVPRGGDLRPGTNGRAVAHRQAAVGDRRAGSPKIYIRTITWRDKTSDPGTADNRVAFRISAHAMYSDKRDRRDVPRDHEGGVGKTAGAAARTKFSVVVVALVTLLRE